MMPAYAPPHTLRNATTITNPISSGGYEWAFHITTRARTTPRTPATMIGRRRPHGVWRWSERAPTAGGRNIAKTPPMPVAMPMAAPWLFFAINSATCSWSRIV